MILYRNDGTLTGLTLTETTGTVTIVSGKIAVASGLAGSFDSCGFVQTSSIAGASGRSWYGYIEYNSFVDAFFGFVDTANFAYTDSLSFYQFSSSNRAKSWEKGGFTADAVNSGALTANVSYLVLLDVESDGTVTYTFDGSEIGHSVVATSGDYTSKNLRFYASPWGVSQTLSIDTMGVTDSGGFTPPAPTTLAAGSPTATTLQVTWSDATVSSTNADSIRVERSTTGGGVGFSEIGTASIGAQVYNDSGLTAGTTYYYRIRARVTVGPTDYNSAYTSEASASTTSPASGGIAGSSSSMNIRAKRLGLFKTHRRED